ncbi:polymorphic toxin type 50 domain-containing protein [Bacillus infantis]|uniref:polymorphic toxin type 50 domain-containing protein n=1 Tax=Bacillus infantis TaxID=324767 RepID=UPI0021553EA2|nr:polymorphic toxin type 50 domain-containing protein [Bacillus infantis]MCR6610574.1 hypothetical protein [Bacillus infantis]
MKKLLMMGLILCTTSLFIFTGENSSFASDTNSPSNGYVEDVLSDNQLQKIDEPQNIFPVKKNLFLGAGGTTINVHGTSYPAYINRQLQNKHIRGTKEYIPGRGIFSHTVEDADVLLKSYGGTGQKIITGKERVAFGRSIGLYIDIEGTAWVTTKGVIHYSKTGAHIIPAAP